MATKRRKVWVNEYDADDEGPGGLGDLAWDHPGDPPHSKGCIIGPYVDFARAEGVAAERARVVALVRAATKAARAEMGLPTEGLGLRGDMLWQLADRIERGEHDKEGE